MTKVSYQAVKMLYKTFFFEDPFLDTIPTAKIPFICKVLIKAASACQEDTINKQL